MPTTGFTTIVCAALLGLSQPTLAGSVTPHVAVADCAESGDAAEPCRGTKSCNERWGDEVWVVSCRGLPCPQCGCPEPPDVAGQGLKYWRYDREHCRWLRLDLPALQATDALDLPTTVWVHGARTTHAEAFDVGWQFYRQLVRGCNPDTPVRVIIWSWPSTQDHKLPRRDLRSEAARADPAGWRLGWLLEQLQPDQQVCLTGFSFGARVISAALHLLGGGPLMGQALDVPAAGSPRRYRAVLMAAAMHSDALQPGQAYGRALRQLDELLLLNNQCDWVLKRYGKLYCRRRGPQALGYAGLSFTSSMAPYRSLVRQVNAGVYIGREHAWRAYIYSPALLAMMRRAALPDRLGEDH